MAAKLAGGGKAKYELGQNADINVTPFVDVMLVLLIIFMVAAPLATTSLAIDLPPAEAPKNPQDQKKPTFISITKDAIYVIPDASLGPTQKIGDLAHLTSVITPLLTGTEPNPKDRTVLIRADRDVKYKQFMAVVNQLETEGFYHVGLISEDLG